MSSNKNPCETPSGAKEFQSNMADLLEKMGASQQCKQSSDTFFDSGSSSSGSNLQTGSTSNSMDSSLDTSLTGNTTNVYVNAPSAFGVSLGDAGAQNVYTTSGTKTGLSTSQGSTQLNLTEQEASAFNKGATKMSSEGCGTVVLNATKISNTKKKMSCFLKSRKYDSSVNVQIGNEIIIKQIPTPVIDCTKFTSEAVQMRCLDQYSSSTMNLSGATLRQKANATVKTKISLSDSDKKTLVEMQKEIANEIVEGKLTSDNKLDALPQSGKDIIIRDTTIDETVSNTSLDEKISNANIKLEGGNKIIIEYMGNFDGRNLVIDQDAVANMITEMLFTDSVEAGVSASKEIEETFKKETGMSLSATGQDLSAIADSGNKGNVDAITAGQAGVNAAAANQVSVDPEKLGAANADMNKSNSALLDSKGEADKGVVGSTGENAVGLTDAQGDSVKGMVDSNRADDNSFIIYIFIGLGVLALIGLAATYIKSKKSTNSTDPTSTIESSDN
jgi:F0F1-type ATP synthase delta subunit